MTGCIGRTLLPDDNGGESDGGSICAKLGADACDLNPACKPIPACPDCEGRMAFPGCEDASTTGGLLCSPLHCNDNCAGLSEGACNANANCTPLYCGACGSSSFLECYDPSNSAPSCPAPPGGCPTSCTDATDAQNCTDRGHCHPVYADCCDTCDCTGEIFDFCSDGIVADCTPQGSCSFMPVSCDSPMVLSYANGCEAGCVYPSECEK